MTLLERAKNRPRSPRGGKGARPRPVSNEEREAVAAWIRGEVSINDLAEAYGHANNNATGYRMALVLKEMIRNREEVLGDEGGLAKTA